MKRNGIIYFFIFFSVLVLFVSGCGSNDISGDVTKEALTHYVCPDKTTVLDASLCPELECPQVDCSICPIRTETKTIPNNIYVCQDLTEVKNKEDCLKADSEGWYEVTTLYGKGQTTTKKVHISGNEWRYSVKCDLSTAGYNIQVFDGNSKPITMNLMVPCNDQFKEYSYVYQGNNDFYFEIFGTNWGIRVESKK